MENRRKEMNQIVQRFENSNEENNEMEELIENFLKFENPSKTILFQLIDQIEIDENKNAFVKFAFRE